MSQASPFRHQAYSAARPGATYHVVRSPAMPQCGCDEYHKRMRWAGAALRRSGVACIYLTHGTFVGPDALGILAEVGRVFPTASEAVRGVVKRIVDKVAGEAGNYTAEYAARLEASLHKPGQRLIPVRLFRWSSENHHIGRADGAVRLIDELASREFPLKGSVLLWGHSHAGNVFALATNLLGGDREKIRRFFEAAEVYYRRPVVGRVDVPVWKRVRKLLEREAPAAVGLPLDIVTFGTPIRYGWDSAGYAKLLHFVNHRAAEGLPEYRAVFPPKLDDIKTGANGDYLQQLGIAGTNVMPGMLTWRTWLADQRLNRLLQGDMRHRDTLERFQAGAIVPDEGTTLLVDYDRPEGGIAQHIAGHAVYTRQQWMLFHAEEVARRLYEAV